MRRTTPWKAWETNCPWWARNPTPIHCKTKRVFEIKWWFQMNSSEPTSPMFSNSINFWKRITTRVWYPTMLTKHISQSTSPRRTLLNRPRTITAKECKSMPMISIEMEIATEVTISYRKVAWHKAILKCIFSNIEDLRRLFHYKCPMKSTSIQLAPLNSPNSSQICQTNLSKPT